MKPRRTPPPFEPVASTTWREWSRGFRKTLFLPMLRRERQKWIDRDDVTDFRVFSCGHFVEAHGHFHEREGLDEGVYIYCVAGQGIYQQNHKSRIIKPGELLYCFPKTRHSYAADKADPWTIHWMHVSGPKARLYETALGLTPAAPLLRIGLQPEIIYLFNLLYRLAQPVFDPDRARALQNCAQLILSTVALIPKSASSSHNQTRMIHATQDYMERVVEQRLGLDHFAQRAEVSPAHFSRLFKAHTKFAPIEYFLRLKIHKACSLLATSGMNVKEIATQLGFEDQNYFSRLFRKVMGMSPKEYRQGIFDTK